MVIGIFGKGVLDGHTDIWTYGRTDRPSYREKKLQSVFGFLTYSRETRFLFSYEEAVALDQANELSNEIDRVSKLDYSLSFGTKQNAL